MTIDRWNPLSLIAYESTPFPNIHIMKKYLLLLALSLIGFKYSAAQVTCIFCFEQNDSISYGVTNLLLNGSFENTNCIPNDYTSSFCPNSNYYSCSVPDWICTGGGISTYASIDDTNFTTSVDGANCAYFGNGSFAHSCSMVNNDTSCLTSANCILENIPAGYPNNDINYGGTTGVSLEQTVNGLVVGSTYVLEFWAGGEPQSHGWTKPGVFAIDVGFGNIFMRCKATGLGYIGTRYIVEFNATSSSHTIKFTNWGHICIPCTELIIDNVRLYRIAQLSKTVPHCVTGINSSGENISTTISPNPFSEMATIHFSRPLTSATLNIYNIYGQLVQAKTHLSGNEIILNREGLCSGIYIYEVTHGVGKVSTGMAVIY
jgi:hypothetical protein